MNYIKLNIEVAEGKQEELISILSDNNALGFEQLPNYLLAYFYEEDFNRHAMADALKAFAFEIVTVEEENWNAVWESNFQPVIIDAFCAIRADFHEPVKGILYEIIITPKMSFGTGHHATTYMMILQMQRINFNSKSVFDFGTGTGVLAILSEKLGASSVTAIDIDEWSITNSLENSKRNSCVKISIKKESKLPLQQKFAILLANINKNVILDNLAGLCDMMQADAVLILSGLLKEDEQEVDTICNKLGLKLFNKIGKENWISLAYKLM